MKCKRMIIWLIEKYTTVMSAIVFTTQRYASTIYAVIVCLSVSPSVTCRNYTETAKPRITQTKRGNEVSFQNIMVTK